MRQLTGPFRVKDRQSLTDITTYLDMCRRASQMPSAILVDAHVEGAMGGTGHKAPWELLTEFRPGVPLILAGGLTPENVGEAIRVVRPAGVDVASGVESGPRRKDPDKVGAFIAAAREAAGVTHLNVTKIREAQAADVLALSRIIRRDRDVFHVEAWLFSHAIVEPMLHATASLVRTPSRV